MIIQMPICKFLRVVSFNCTCECSTSCVIIVIQVVVGENQTLSPGCRLTAQPPSDDKINTTPGNKICCVHFHYDYCG